MNARQKLEALRDAEHVPLFAWVPELGKYCDSGNNHWCHPAPDVSGRWAVVCRYGFGDDPHDTWRYFPDKEAALQFYASYLAYRMVVLARG